VASGSWPSYLAIKIRKIVLPGIIPDERLPKGVLLRPISGPFFPRKRNPSILPTTLALSNTLNCRYHP
jgi:hypothetical protein